MKEQVTNKAAILVENLNVAYDEQVVVENVSWQVERGQLAAIIGPNGGGKSTLLKSLLGVIPQISGEVLLYGKPAKQARSLVAYLPQSEEVDWDFPISCIEVVNQGRLVKHKWWQKPTTADQEFANECLSLVGMEDYANQPIGALSGGQRQRVFLARALAQQAEMIIMDEPGTGLDAAVQHELLDMFYQLKKQGRTIVITTHDLNCLAANFDVVLGLNKGVVLSGPPQQVLDAKGLTTLFAKHFPVIGPAGEVSMHD